MKLKKIIEELRDSVAFYEETEQEEFIKEMDSVVSNFILTPNTTNLVSYDIKDYGFYIFSRSFINFWDTPQINYYKELQEGLYYMISGNMISYFTKEEADSTATSTASALLSSLFFDTKEEQRLLYLALLDHLEEQRNKYPLCEDSLLGFTFLMYNRYSNEDEKWKSFINKPLNTIYQTFSDMYMSDNCNLFKDSVNSMCESHLINCKESYMAEFYMPEWRAFASEILLPLHKRAKMGKDITDLNHPLIEKFIPYLQEDFSLSGRVNQYRESLFGKYLSLI